MCRCVCSCPCYLVGTRIHSSWIGALVGLTRGDFFAGAPMTEVHKFMLLLLLLDDAFGVFTEKYFVLAGLLSIFTAHFRCEQLSKVGWQRSPWPQPLPLRDGHRWFSQSSGDISAPHTSSSQLFRNISHVLYESLKFKRHPHFISDAVICILWENKQGH